MRRILAAAIIAASLSIAIGAPTVSADPGAANPKVQYRSFTCDDGGTYDGAFVGFNSGNFFIVDSTSVFAFKVITLYYPSGDVASYNYGLPGFDPSSLITCWYTDPQGVFTVFSGWFTPRA